MKESPPYDALEKLFHEPNRLAIMSALCASQHGLTFTELRDTCRLTDGNLNRHLNVLEEGHAIKIAKRFVAKKPQTRVRLSASGMARFSEYLDALKAVLEEAQSRLPAEEQNREKVPFPVRTVRAGMLP